MALDQAPPASTSAFGPPSAEPLPHGADAPTPGAASAVGTGAAVGAGASPSPMAGMFDHGPPTAGSAGGPPPPPPGPAAGLAAKVAEQGKLTGEKAAAEAAAQKATADLQAKTAQKTAAEQAASAADQQAAQLDGKMAAAADEAAKAPLRAQAAQARATATAKRSEAARLAAEITQANAGQTAAQAKATQATTALAAVTAEVAALKTAAPAAALKAPPPPAPPSPPPPPPPAATPPAQTQTAPDGPSKPPPGTDAASGGGPPPPPPPGPGTETGAPPPIDPTHPAVKDVMANNATDTPAEHQKRVAEALTAVQQKVAERDDAKREEIMAGGEQVTAGTVIIGGSTLGTLDAGTLPEDKQKNALGVSQLAQSQRPGGPVPPGQAKTMDQWASYGDYPMGQSGAQLGQYKLQPPPSEEERKKQKQENPELAGQKAERGPDDKLIEDPKNPGFRGMAVSPVDLQQDPDKLLRSNELALATAETRRQSEVPFVPGKPIGGEDGGVQVRPTEPSKEDTKAHAEWQKDLEKRGWPKDPGGNPVASYVECEMLNPDGTPAMEKKEKKDADGNPVIDPATGQPDVEEKPVTKKICATDTMDICVGPGPGRKFATGEFDVPETPEEKYDADKAAKAQRKPAIPTMAPEDQKQLTSTGAMQTAEEYLGGRAQVNEGEKVLVAGGGPSGAWAVQSAAAAGGDVDWQGRPAQDKPKLTKMEKDADGNEKPVFTDFGKAENDVQRLVGEVGGNTPTDAQTTALEEAKKKYNDELKKHEEGLHAEAQKKLEASQAKRLPPGATAEDEQKLKDEIKKNEKDVKALEGDEPEKGAFPGADLDRNVGTAGNKKAKEILRVVPITEGPDVGKTRVFFEDGTFETYDKVITAMAQDDKAPGGPADLMQGVKVLIPIWDGDPPQPVGLQTPGGEVRVMGASAFMVRDKLNPTDKAAYEKAIFERSGKQKSTQQQVSSDSTGVDWGFEAMGDTPARANEERARVNEGKPPTKGPPETSSGPIRPPASDDDASKAAGDIAKEAGPTDPASSSSTSTSPPST